MRRRRESRGHLSSLFPAAFRVLRLMSNRLQLLLLLLLPLSSTLGTHIWLWLQRRVKSTFYDPHHG